MPLSVRKDGHRYQVVDDKGEVYGTHPSKEAARRQIIAIEISKREKAHKK